MWVFRLIAVMALAFIIPGCSDAKFKRYDGPEVTSIQVHKSARKMYLLHHDKVLKTYRIGLGFAPDGHKQFEGDGRTPEGTYVINRRNPNSEFHLSLGISYPNARDIETARASSKSPGGDIFIHGQANRHKGRPADWTAGCIAVKDGEIEDVYAMVRDGTVIHILP